MRTLDATRRVLEGPEWLAPDAFKLAPLLIGYGKLVRRPTGAWVHAEGDEDTGLLIVVDGAIDLFAMGLANDKCVLGSLGQRLLCAKACVSAADPVW